MLHEFALDPQLLRNWEEARYLSDKFGVHTGRLIAEFPRGWPNLVREAFKEARDVEKKRITHVLELLKRDLLPTQRKYSLEQPWLVNAESGHQEAPFHAILSNENPRAHPRVMIGAELSELESPVPTGAPIWRVPREAAVPRTPEGLAGAVGPLLRISKEILFVDPYFSPENYGQWNLTLREMLLAANAGLRCINRCEYHIEASTDPKELAFQNEEYPKILARVLPKKSSIKIVRWTQRPGNERLHARYVLTERGGIRIEGGLDKGATGETVDATLLDPALWERRWNDYQIGSKVFTFQGQIVVQSS